MGQTASIARGRSASCGVSGVVKILDKSLEAGPWRRTVSDQTTEADPDASMVSRDSSLVSSPRGSSDADQDAHAEAICTDRDAHPFYTDRDAHPFAPDLDAHPEFAWGSFRSVPDHERLAEAVAVVEQVQLMIQDHLALEETSAELAAEFDRAWKAQLNDRLRRLRRTSGAVACTLDSVVPDIYRTADGDLAEHVPRLLAAMRAAAAAAGPRQ